MGIAPARAKRIALWIAAVGLGGALAIFLFAPPAEENPLGYDPLTNKKYVHELRVYGGKANVLSAEIMQWFGSLWHGRNLAYTVAALSVSGAWCFWFVATLPKLEERTGDKAPAVPPRSG